MNQITFYSGTSRFFQFDVKGSARVLNIMFTTY